jgi:3-hydroxymyristoyl/3-hydroxydecanoyl-(acyl carrier protein) dehydratase
MPEHNPGLPLPAHVIPHRPPHLWLDGVTEVTPGIFGKGFWTPGQEHFDGHFDAFRLLMGVKQVESIVQLGTYVGLISHQEPTLGIFKGIDKASFLSPVRPGDTLDIEVIVSDKTKREFTANGLVMVAGRTTCEATFTGTMLPERVAHAVFNRMTA